ncbi:MAG: hypothetical protein OZ948_04690 [Deltaproteobacteria bacterium]|nr:hypothetical protein [Deltaproteobacteria bacterium]
MTRAGGECCPSVPVRVGLPARPAWLEAIVAGEPRAIPTGDEGFSLEMAGSGSLTLLHAVVRQARLLDDRALRSAARRIYGRIGRALDEAKLHAWRYWNYVPAIGAAAEIAGSRYQVFNIGRYEALQDAWGASFVRHLAAASAVGHDGEDLVIDVLAGAVPGRSVANPRQAAPWRYTRRWGPRPPCFARAMIVPAWERATAHRFLIASGTASIVDEDSLHPGDLRAQLEETCRNLTALLSAAVGSGVARYQELRIYVAREADVEIATDLLHRTFPALSHLEAGVASLCREELLVEVEGLASIDV